MYIYIYTVSPFPKPSFLIISRQLFVIFNLARTSWPPSRPYRRVNVDELFVEHGRGDDPRNLDTPSNPGEGNSSVGVPVGGENLVLVMPWPHWGRMWGKFERWVGGILNWWNGFADDQICFCISLEVSPLQMRWLWFVSGCLAWTFHMRWMNWACFLNRWNEFGEISLLFTVFFDT